MEYGLAFMFAFGVFLTFAGIAASMVPSHRVDTLVKQYAEPRALEDVELAQPFSVRVVKPLVRSFARLLGRFTPKQFVESSRHKLMLAGNPYDWSPAEFLGIRGLSGVFGVAIGAFLFGLLNAGGFRIVLFAAIGAVLGFYLPVFWLNMKIRSRQEELERTLPDVLDLLTICVEAGLSLDGAMAKVAETWDNAMSRAFGRASTEMRLGKPRQHALRDIANRAGVRDVTTFAAAVIQAEQLGTGIAKVLRIQAEQMRVLRRQRAQERANQTPVKILFPLALCIFPSMFIVILGPAVIRLIVQKVF